MKKSIKNVALFLGGIIVTGFLFSAAAYAQAGDNKPAGKPWAVPEKEAKTQCPLVADSGIIAAGRDVYMEQCKSCHGKTGKGDGPRTKSIDISIGDFTSADFQKHTDGEIFWKISEGRKPMPTHKFKLSDTDRWTVVIYLRTLAKNGTDEHTAVK